ncbi:MAG: hypothetical protein JXR83_09945 [Deltaproteobacteria bacterium]|nr:hypothetical protein [Deltaproteobacteria bacterium]
MTALAASAGCTCGSTFRTTCSSDDQCPTGYLCRADLCRLAGADTDAAADDGSQPDAGPGDCATARDGQASDLSRHDGNADGSQPDAALPDRGPVDGGASNDAGPLDTGSLETGYLDRGPAPPCGTTSVYQDDFTDGLQPYWLRPEQEGAHLATSSSGLQLTTPAVVQDPVYAYAGVMTPYQVELLADALTVHVTAADMPDGSEAFVELWHDEENTMRFMVNAGVLYADIVGPGNPPSQRIGPLANFVPGFWRIREQGGSVEFQTRVGVSEWQTHCTTATALHLTRGHISLGLGAYFANNTPATITFGSVNLDRPATTWCRASSWQDDFDDSSLRPEWAIALYPDNHCSVTLQDQKLRISNLAGGGSYCGVLTGSAYNLVDDSISIEMTEYPTGTLVFPLLTVQGGGLTINYGKWNSSLDVQIRDQSGIIWGWQQPFAGTERWLIISHYDDGLISFEYQALQDGPLFHFAATQTSLHLDQVAIGVVSWCGDGCDANGALVVDNYNL